MITNTLGESATTFQGNGFPRPTLYDFLTLTVRTPQAQLGWGKSKIFGRFWVPFVSFRWTGPLQACILLFRCNMRFLRSICRAVLLRKSSKGHIFDVDVSIASALCLDSLHAAKSGPKVFMCALPWRFQMPVAHFGCPIMVLVVAIFEFG